MKPTRFALVTIILLSAVFLDAQQLRFNAELVKGITFRNLGPYRAGSWVSDIAVPDAPQKAHLYTFYVAARNGGVWKTTNNGTTFQPIFEGQNVCSIGALAVAPTSADIVWVGTGDASHTRSAHPGDGVYKSIDGGKTWQHVGLQDSQHIARIVIHPKNPDIVYVASMGHLYTPNPERGVFKTADGGKTWTKVLYVNDTIGVIDLVMNQTNPNVLYAAAYEKYRYPWRFVEGGEGSAVYQTTDGGKTWNKLGGGLPGGRIGRIGLDIYQKNPKIVYALVENANMRPPTEEEAKQARERGLEPRERMIGGELYRSDDGGRAWQKMSSGGKADLSAKAGYSFNQVRVDPANDKRLLVNSDSMISSEDGGRTWTGVSWDSRNLFANAFGDFRCMWIDPQNPDRIIAGSDGAVSISYDGGKTCDSYTNLPLGEFYAIDVDMDEPYNIYGGLQDHESWKGPSNGKNGYISIEDWVTVGEGDGMYNQVDKTDSRWLYNEREFGDHHRADQKLHTRTPIMPKRPAGQPPYRFNWTAPILISPHNSTIIYTGADVVLRSLDRGDHWQEISPDLTTNDKTKISPPGGTIQHCTITTLSESPVTAGIIWAGTDDGKVQVTQNFGATWTDVTAKLVAAGAPASFWVTRVLASRWEPATAYVTKSGLRNDDFRPMVFRTTDFGATWTPIMANLPGSSANVIVEDVKSRNLLFGGLDNGAYASIDGGQRWVRFDLPTSHVWDLAVHPREGDLVVATFGRGLFVGDVTPLGEVSEDMLAKDLHLFAIRPKARQGEGAWGNFKLYGDRDLATPNEPDGLVFTYYVKAEPKEKAVVRIADPYGTVVRTIEATAKVGLNRVVWDTKDSDKKLVPPGEYVVTIEAAGQKVTGRARLLPQRN